MFFIYIIPILRGLGGPLKCLSAKEGRRPKSLRNADLDQGRTQLGQEGAAPRRNMAGLSLVEASP